MSKGQEDLQHFYLQTLNETQKLSKIGSWNWNVLTNEVIWSDMMFTLLGLELNEHSPSYELALNQVHPEDKAQYEETLGLAMANQTEYHLENRIIKSDHSVIHVISRGNCYFDEKGDLIQMIGTVQDVTFFKENELRLKESERLKASFLANISHEIRTPLNAILGFSSLLKRENLSNEKKDQYLELVRIGGEKLLNIISDIIDISKSDTNQLSINTDTCHLNQLIDNLQRQFNIHDSNKIGQIKTTKGLTDTKSTILTDELRLTQILSKLLENALKFTHKGSVEMGYLHENKTLKFYIKDSGIGIDAKNHSTIFERFSQVNNDYSKAESGNGLGLPIVQSLTELLGGKVWVDSELNKGATFYFTIPYQTTQ
jgi:signal transduction histidine kinase